VTGGLPQSRSFSKPWGCRSSRTARAAPVAAAGSGISSAGTNAPNPLERSGTRAHTTRTPEMRSPAFLEVPGRANRMP
jgi:hypothetical protein